MPKPNRPLLGPGLSLLRSKKELHPSEKKRAMLTGTLLYGEEAIRALRSDQYYSTQGFRQNHDTKIPSNNNIFNKNSKHQSKMNNETEVDIPQLVAPPPTGNYFRPIKEEQNVHPRRLIGGKIPNESFLEFSKRVNTLSANKFDLDPELYDSFVELSLGQRQKSSAFDWGPTINNLKTPKTPGPDISFLYNMNNENNMLDPNLKRMKPFEATFGEQEKRSSGSESDAFRPSDRYWRKNLLKKQTRENKKGGRYISRKSVGGLSNNTMSVTQNHSTHYRTPKQDINKKPSNYDGIYKSNIIEEGQILLKHATKLLQESSKLRLREELEKQTPKEINFIPLKMKGSKINPKLTFHDRIQQKRENIIKNGYKIDQADENKIDWNEKDISSSGKTLKKVDSNNGQFGKEKLSSLVGQNVAAIQGRRINYNPEDDMNPLEKKMVEGLENFELSYFLNGPGHRSPRLAHPPRPISKKEQRIRLTTGKGQTSFMNDSTKEQSTSIKNPLRIDDSKITKYLDELRLSGYPDWPSKNKQRSEKHQEALKFLQMDNSYDFDESILNNFKMTAKKKQDFIDALKEKRLQRIRMKASIPGNKSTFNHLEKQAGMPQ